MIFPTPTSVNTGFYNVGQGSAVPFSVLAMDALPDLHVTGAGSGGQFFARYTYVEDSEGQLDVFGSTDGSGWSQVDNITDQALADYRQAYGSQVTKDDIFYYVYGLLHSPDYRTTFAADLKKMLPRIPMVPDVEDFTAFVNAGRELAELHIGYEQVEPYPLNITELPGPGVTGKALFDYYRVEKMRFAGAGKTKDRSAVVYNPRITVSGIPDEAYEYLLGSRSAIEWILERYQIKTDKASGIVNDPNDWSRETNQPRYILDLLARIVTVSVKTVRIVKSLPTIDFEQCQPSTSSPVVPRP